MGPGEVPLCCADMWGSGLWSVHDGGQAPGHLELTMGEGGEGGELYSDGENKGDSG